MIALYSSSFATALSVRFCCSAIALTASMTRGSSLYIFETVSTCGRPDPLRRPPCVVFGFVRLRGMQSLRVCSMGGLGFTKFAAGEGGKICHS